LLGVEWLEERALPSIVVLGTSKDNTLYQSTAGDISNGAGPNFFAGLTRRGAIHRGVIAFNIAGSIPAGAHINSVALQLNVSMTTSGAATVQLRPLLADWGEGTSDAESGTGRGAPATPNDATWLYRFFNTTRWTTPGGDFSSVASASASVGGPGPYTWSSTAQMVSDVQGWLDSPGSNFGWAVIGDETTSSSSKRFDTKENPTPGNRPMLTIDYTAPAVPSSLVLTGYPNPATAGAGGTERVTVQDAAGQVVTNYRGTVHFTSSDPQADLPLADYTFTAADAGVHDFSITLKTAGLQFITATDTALTSLTGSQTGILVNADVLHHLSIVTTGPVTAGAPFDLIVTAQDRYNNTVTSYLGTVTFQTFDPNSRATVPADYTFTAADSGSHLFPLGATLFSTGAQTIVVTDTSDSTITGSLTVTL
jgi:hypothetical protein